MQHSFQTLRLRRSRQFPWLRDPSPRIMVDRKRSNLANFLLRDDGDPCSQDIAGLYKDVKSYTLAELPFIADQK